MIGSVEIPAVQFGPGGHQAFQTWKYQCRDGLVLCIGCKCERFVERNWLTVRAIFVF